MVVCLVTLDDSLQVRCEPEFASPFCHSGLLRCMTWIMVLELSTTWLECCIIQFGQHVQPGDVIKDHRSGNLVLALIFDRTILDLYDIACTPRNDVDVVDMSGCIFGSGDVDGC